MASGIPRVRPGLNAARSSSGSRQHKRLNDVFKRDIMTPLVFGPGIYVHLETMYERKWWGFALLCRNMFQGLKNASSTLLGERWEWKCFQKTKAEVNMTGCR